MNNFLTSRLRKTILNKLDFISGEILLFLEGPKEYLYIFFLPKNQQVIMKPYRSNMQSAADKVVNRIKKIDPDLKIHFIGSASLHILGRGDIDLYAESSPAKFDYFLPVFSSLFGEPSKKRGRYIEWKFKEGAYNVELSLIDPSTNLFKSQIAVYEKLKKDRELLNNYKLLKSKLNGLSVQEYTKRRMRFFNTFLYQ